MLVGHSLGGWAAAEIATKTTSDIDRLVLIDPIGIKVGPPDRLDIPDIFAMPQDQLNSLLYAEPNKWKLGSDENDRCGIARRALATARR